MQTWSHCATLVTALSLIACTPQAPPQATDTTAGDIAALKADDEAFLAAWNAGDPAGLASYYADDAVEMAPGFLHEGRDEILKGFSEYYSQFTATQTATTAEVVVLGDVALQRGDWTVRETPKAGGPEQTKTGKWMVIRKRQADGSWKTWRWMWNEQPATPNPAG